MAFDTIYRRYIPKLFSFLKGFYASEYQSEEIAQEIFITIWEKRDRLDENLSFCAYIFQAAKNKIYNSYRDKVKQLEFNNAYSFHVDNGRNYTDEYINYKEAQEYTREIINELPPVQKKIFLLSRNDGLTNGEIAQRLNISRRTVEQHIYKAIKHFKKSMLTKEVYLLIFICIL